MGVDDDEGTPPAEHEGFLTSEVCSPVYSAANTHRQESWGAQCRYQNQPSKNSRQSWKEVLVPSEASRGSLDLIRLLEESWFWRSSTASPSMVEPSTSYGQTSSDNSTGQQRHSPASASQHSSSLNSHSAAGSSRVSPASDLEIQGDAPSQESEPERSSEQDKSPKQVMQAPAASRRAQSADLDGLGAACGATETRAHSYTNAPGFKSRRNGVESADPTLGDPLGTWAQRVFRFAPDRKSSQPTHIPGTPDVAELHPRAKRDAVRSAIPEADEEGGEDAVLEAAWRWRFNRRWRTEQAKQFDPNFGMDGDDEDGWDTALGYLGACGPGYHLQIARTTSADRNLGASSLKSNSSDLSNLLMEDSQKEKSALKEQAEMDATKSLVSVAKKARDLFDQQQKIEKDVQRRWGSTRVSMAWAGQHLSGVKIDSYGRFPFILAKVSDRTLAHRLLVRGKNGADKNELMRSLTAEVKETCRQQGLATVSLALLGSGVMEWSRERDHRINISAGRVEKGCDPSIQGSNDVTRLAGALTRASLSAPNRVAVNGEKLS